MKSYKSREDLISKLNEISRLKKLDTKFLTNNLQILLDGTDLVIDRRRQSDIKDELKDAVETIKRLMAETVPRMKTIYDNRRGISSQDEADFEHLAETWQSDANAVLEQIRRVSKDLIGNLSKGESIANRSMLRNASFQEREMRARLSTEGYLMLKKFQSQLDMAQGWLFSAPASGEGSVSDIKRFIKDLNEIIRLLTKTRVLKGIGGAGYFLNTLTFMTGNDLLRVASLERRLTRPETYYHLTNFQSEDLSEAEASASRRVERMNQIKDALSGVGLKAADLVTLGVASPVFRALGSLYRGTTATARFVSNVPSYLSTVASKVGDARLMVKQSRPYRAAKSVSKALLTPKSTLRAAGRFIQDRANAVRRQANLARSRARFASNAFRGANGVRGKLGLLTKRGRAKAGFDDPSSPFYKPNLGASLASKLRSQGVDSLGADIPTDLRAGFSDDFTDDSSSSFSGDSNQDRGSDRDRDDTADRVDSSLRKASVRSRKDTSLMSDRIVEQIMDLEALVNRRFDTVEGLITQVLSNIANGSSSAGPQVITPGGRSRSMYADDVIDVEARETAAQRAEKSRDEETAKGLFRRQVVALEKLVNWKGSARKVGDMLSSSVTMLKGVLSSLGLGGLLDMLKGLPSLLTMRSLSGLLLRSLPGLLTNALGSFFGSPAGRGILAAMAGGFAIDAAVGTLGVGKDKDGNQLKLDLEQDKLNWERMSMLEKAMSGTARSIEMAGKMFFMDNMATQAAADRIASETAALNEKAAEKPRTYKKSNYKYKYDPASIRTMAHVASGAPVKKSKLTPLPTAPASSSEPKMSAGIPAAAAAAGAPSSDGTRVDPSSLVPRTSSTGTTDQGGGAASKAGDLFRVEPGVDMNLDPNTRTAFEQMVAEYRATGGKHDVIVTSGRRSSAQQAALYAKNPKLAAKPGRSDHERGLALDIDRKAANEMDKMGLLKKYGFTRPVSGEPWHLTSAQKGQMFVGDEPKTNEQSPASMRLSKLSNSFSRPTINTIYGEQEMTAYTALGGPINTTTEPETPVSKSVPPPEAAIRAPAAAEQEKAADKKVGTTGSNPSVGLTQVPTYSYLDGGFFILNAGMMA